MNSTVRTLTSKVEDSENEKNKNGARIVQPFRKLVKAATGKRQLIFRYRTKGNDLNDNKKNLAKIKNQKGKEPNKQLKIPSWKRKALWEASQAKKESADLEKAQMQERHHEKRVTSDGRSRIILRRKRLFGSYGEEIELTSREETGRLKTEPDDMVPMQGKLTKEEANSLGSKKCEAEAGRVAKQDAEAND